MTEMLRDLWRFKPEDSWILLWSLQNGRSEFYADVEVAITAATRLAERGDVYVGTGLRARALPPSQRGGTDDVVGIAALWLDVDVVDEAHQKVNLFPSKEEAEHFINQVTPLKPSYLVDSGHGLQAWWLFNEPWMFADADERRSAIDLSRRWSNTFRFRAHEAHLDIDAVHDLSRVMRIPGTFNYKDVERGGRRLPVTIRIQHYMGAEIARYSPSDFEPYLMESPETDPEAVTDVGEFKINLMADPPMAKFDLLQDTHIKFKQSWRHERKDMQDQSLSSYDMSLAAIAAYAGWSTQEIVDLLIAHRRRYGETGSHKNMEDYLRRTLRKSAPRHNGVPSANPDNPEIAAPQAPPLMPPPKRSKESEYGAVMNEIAASDSLDRTLSLLSGVLGPIQILGIIKYRSEPPSYVMDTNHGKVRFDKVETLVSQTGFRQRVYDVTKRMVRQFKRDQWDDILNIFGDIMEEQDVADDATDAGMVISYLVHYLNDRAPTESLSDAYRTQSSFFKDGQLYIFGPAFRAWIHTNYRHLIAPRELGLMLRNVEASQRTIGFQRPSGSWTTKHCWHIPERIAAEALGE